MTDLRRKESPSNYERTHEHLFTSIVCGNRSCFKCGRFVPAQGGKNKKLFGQIHFFLQRLLMTLDSWKYRDPMEVAMRNEEARINKEQKAKLLAQPKPRPTLHLPRKNKK